MRVTAVPAQVTTVEDRIMGNLGFSQLVLFILPIFIGGGLFIVLPPFMHGSLYKYVLITVISVLSVVLAIRIKGKIILYWLITIIRYNLRPKYYVYQKSLDHREHYESVQKDVAEASSLEPDEQISRIPHLAFPDAAYALEAISEPDRNVRFEMTKKGGLHVRLTKIED